MAKIFRMDGTEMEQEEPLLVTRRNPYVTSGPYHDGILLDAARSMQEPAWDGEVAYYNKHMIQSILNSPEITQQDAPYAERIKVPWRMIQMAYHDFREWFDIDGWIYDPKSGGHSGI